MNRHWQTAESRTVALPPVAEQEHATILAALRFYQEQGQGDPAERTDAIHDIATNASHCTSLDDDGIDELCEHLNLDSQDIKTPRATKRERVKRGAPL